MNLPVWDKLGEWCVVLGMMMPVKIAPISHPFYIFSIAVMVLVHYVPVCHPGCEPPEKSYTLITFKGQLG